MSLTLVSRTVLVGGSPYRLAPELPRMNKGIPNDSGKTRAQNQEKPESWYLLTVTLNPGRVRKRTASAVSRRLKPTRRVITTSMITAMASTE